MNQKVEIDGMMRTFIPDNIISSSSIHIPPSHTSIRRCFCFRLGLNLRSVAAMFKESERAEDGVGLVRQLLTRSRTLVLIKHITILYFVTITWPHAVSLTVFRGENRSEPCATPLLCESMLPSTNKLYNSKTVFTTCVASASKIRDPPSTN